MDEIKKVYVDSRYKTNASVSNSQFKFDWVRHPPGAPLFLSARGAHRSPAAADKACKSILSNRDP